jgi:hypothetical protein
MSTRIRFLLPLAAFWIVPSVRANNLAYLKCAANQDRVWVYESLSSFDVEAKLRCGAPVEILSRINAFVKIRIEGGVEGYVPDAALPDLPALPDESKEPLGSVAAHSLAAAHKPAAPVSSAPPAAEIAAPQPAQPVVSVQPPSTSAAPMSATSEATVAVSAPVAPAPVKTVAAAKPAPAAATVSAKVSTSSSRAKTATVARKKAEVTAASTPAHALSPAPSVPPTPAGLETVSASPKDSGAIVPTMAMPTANADEDSEEYSDTRPQNDSADPACRVFFAAYGLAPSQYKWMAESRRKEFSGICPAPDPAHVDYVVLFTHDSDSYNYAMPAPVHTDHNGFSDFSPLMTADTALIASSELEKARYEYVWVFHVTRGAFDPAKFSPRRKPQFTTYAKGSRASAHAIEDAFGFVENQGINR